MKMTYDKEADAAYVYLNDTPRSVKNVQVTEDVILDFSAKDELLGIEILNASHHLALNNLKGITLQMLPPSNVVLYI